MNERMLYRFNEWWITGTVRSDLTGRFRRMDYPALKRLIDDRSIVLFYGLRRVGKTTIMYQIISDLLKEGKEPERILYFSFDESSGDIDEMISLYAETVLKKPITEATRIYMFLDEVQKAEDWENRIKIFYDLYPNIKFVLSGSSSLNVLKGSSETLAGRIVRVKIEPLSFSEFCRLKGHEVPYEKVAYARDILGPMLMEYIEKGGFPELVWESDRYKIRSYVRSIVIDRIVTRDIPQEFGIRDMDLMRRLMETILMNPGMILNLDKISSSFGRNRITISNFISYMEYAFLIRTVSNYRPGVEAASRKLKKVYPYIPAFYLAMLASQDAYDTGKLMENAMAAVLSPGYYFRAGNTEIDFVLDHGGVRIPIEVKSGNYDISDFSKALKKMRSDSGILVDQGSMAVKKIDDTTIFQYPIYAMALYPDRIMEEFLSRSDG